MEKVYAQALWEMVSGAPGVEGMDVKKAVHAMFARLEKDGRALLMPRVGRAFVRIAERESRKRDLVLTVAREADISAAKKEVNGYIESLGISSEDLKTQVDDTLIGGWRLEGNERLVDASYKSRLLDLYNRVTRA